MWLHFLYGIYGYAYYEGQDIVGVRIAEFLGNMDNANDIDCLASFVFCRRLEKIGDDKIQDIFSSRANDYVYSDWEYNDAMGQFNDCDRDMYILSIFVGEEKYSEIVRQFYRMVDSKLDDEDNTSYSTLYNFLKSYDKDIQVRLVY